VRPTPLGTPLGESVGVSCYYPDGQHKTLEGCLMSLANELDVACTKAWWVQGELITADL